MKTKISKIGLFVTLFGMFAFGISSGMLIGWGALIITPIITLFATRPANTGGLWLWQKEVRSDIITLKPSEYCIEDEDGGSNETRS